MRQDFLEEYRKKYCMCAEENSDFCDKCGQDIVEEKDCVICAIIKDILKEWRKGWD